MITLDLSLSNLVLLLGLLGGLVSARRRVGHVERGDRARLRGEHRRRRGGGGRLLVKRKEGGNITHEAGG